MTIRYPSEAEYWRSTSLAHAWLLSSNEKYAQWLSTNETVAQARAYLESRPLRFGDPWQIFRVDLIQSAEALIGRWGICPECDGAGKKEYVVETHCDDCGQDHEHECWRICKRCKGARQIKWDVQSVDELTHFEVNAEFKRSSELRATYEEAAA